MRASILHAPNDLRLEDIPAPEPGCGELLVKVRVCGLCGTDINKIRYGGIPLPSVLGHELAGDVAAVGEGVRGFEVGDRVVPTHHLPCFKCAYCVHESHSQCGAFRENNISPGGFSEYVLLNGRAVSGSTFKIPGGVSYEEASFMETAACCLRAFDRGGMLPGDAVLVLGAGTVGLLHVRIASFLGAGTVIAADLSGSRLKAAESAGADHLIDAREDVPGAVRELTSSRGADLVMVTAGNENAYSSGILAAAGGGRVVFFGGCAPGSRISINPDIVYKKELRVMGSYSSTPLEQSRALSMIGEGKLKVEGLVTHRFGLSEVSKAVDTALKPDECLKIMISPAS